MLGIFDRYTLWNAEYRMSLMRNFELPLDGSGKHNSLEVSEGSGLACDEPECEGGKACVVDMDTSEQISSRSLTDLSPEALNYIQQLEAELCSAKKVRTSNHSLLDDVLSLLLSDILLHNGRNSCIRCLEEWVFIRQIVTKRKMSRWVVPLCKRNYGCLEGNEFFSMIADTICLS